MDQSLHPPQTSRRRSNRRRFSLLLPRALSFRNVELLQSVILGWSSTDLQRPQPGQTLLPQRSQQPDAQRSIPLRLACGNLGISGHGGRRLARPPAGSQPRAPGNDPPGPAWLVAPGPRPGHHGSLSSVRGTAQRSGATPVCRRHRRPLGPPLAAGRRVGRQRGPAAGADPALRGPLEATRRPVAVLGARGPTAPTTGPGPVAVHAPPRAHRRLPVGIHQPGHGYRRRPVQLRQLLRAVQLPGRVVGNLRRGTGGAGPRHEPPAVGLRQHRRGNNLPRLVPDEKRADTPCGAGRPNPRASPSAAVHPPRPRSLPRRAGGHDLLQPRRRSVGREPLRRSRRRQRQGPAARSGQHHRTRKPPRHPQQLGHSPGRPGKTRPGGPAARPRTGAGPKLQHLPHQLHPRPPPVGNRAGRRKTLRRGTLRARSGHPARTQRGRAGRSAWPDRAPLGRPGAQPRRLPRGHSPRHLRKPSTSSASSAR